MLYQCVELRTKSQCLQLQEGCGAVRRFDLVDGVPCFRPGGACRYADPASTCGERTPRTRPDRRRPPLQPGHSREVRALYRLQPLYHEDYSDLLQPSSEEEH